MKKVVSCLFTCIIAIMMSFSSVFAESTYDTNKIINAANKVKEYYKENGLSEDNYLDDIIAYEALNGEVEEDFDISDFESRIAGSIDYVGTLSKIIVVTKLLNKNPENMMINNEQVNLVEKLENFIDKQTGCFGEQIGNNNEIWGLIALEAVSSDKVELVANHIASDINEDGGFWYFGWDYVNNRTDYNIKSSSCDVTGWAIEALSIAGENLYDTTIQTAINYLKTQQQDAGYLSYGSANTDTQACVIEGLSVYNRNLLLNGEYNQNNTNPIDVLLQFQNNESGAFGWMDTEDNPYATQDAARALGTIVYGSVIYKINGTEYPELKLKEDNETPVENQDEIKNETIHSVQTGDDTYMIIYVSVAMISGGLYLILRKEHERVH